MGIPVADEIEPASAALRDARREYFQIGSAAKAGERIMALRRARCMAAQNGKNAGPSLDLAAAFFEVGNRPYDMVQSQSRKISQ